MSNFSYSNNYVNGKPIPGINPFAYKQTGGKRKYTDISDLLLNSQHQPLTQHSKTKTTYKLNNNHLYLSPGRFDPPRLSIHQNVQSANKTVGRGAFNTAREVTLTSSNGDVFSGVYLQSNRFTNQPELIPNQIALANILGYKPGVTPLTKYNGQNVYEKLEPAFHVSKENKYINHVVYLLARQFKDIAAMAYAETTDNKVLFDRKNKNMGTNDNGSIIQYDYPFHFDFTKSRISIGTPYSVHPKILDLYVTETHLNRRNYTDYSNTVLFPSLKEKQIKRLNASLNTDQSKEKFEIIKELRLDIVTQNDKMNCFVAGSLIETGLEKLQKLMTELNNNPDKETHELIDTLNNTNLDGRQHIRSLVEQNMIRELSKDTTYVKINSYLSSLHKQYIENVKCNLILQNSEKDCDSASVKSFDSSSGYTSNESDSDFSQETHLDLIQSVYKDVKQLSEKSIAGLLTTRELLDELDRICFDIKPIEKTLFNKDDEIIEDDSTQFDNTEITYDDSQDSTNYTPEEMSIASLLLQIKNGSEQKIETGVY